MGKFNLKKTALLCMMAVMVFAMTACGKNSTASGKEEDGKLKVVTTIFPYYDFVRQIAGDKVSLSMAVPAGMDTHSFEPTAADMIEIGKADILIYNGGEMEVWVDEVIEAAAGKNLKAEEMMKYVDIVTEEIVDGMEEEEEHEHEDDRDDEHEEEEPEYDEHIWTSPVNAQKLVEKIVDILSEADSKNADFYEKNGEAYIEKLEKIDSEMKNVIENAKRDYVVFGDRFPLRYFVDRYDLDYSAAFAGCSSDTEPSADTLAFLIDKVKEKNIPVVLKIELTSPKVAETVSAETGAKVMTFYTCHNVTKEQLDEGVTYCDLMEKNIDVLKEALN